MRWLLPVCIFNAGICSEGHLRVSVASPSPYPTPSWARNSSSLFVCAALLLFVCMRYSEWNCADLVSVFFDICGDTLCRSAIWFCRILQYLWWYAVPIWLWILPIFMMECCADLRPVPVFFDIYSDTLCRSVSVFFVLTRYSVPVTTFQDRTPSPPYPMFFSCRLETSARGKVASGRAAAERVITAPGCGETALCGRVCCLSRSKFNPATQCFPEPNSIPDRSLPGPMPPSSGVPGPHPPTKPQKPHRLHPAGPMPPPLASLSIPTKKRHPSSTLPSPKQKHLKQKPTAIAQLQLPERTDADLPLIF